MPPYKVTAESLKGSMNILVYGKSGVGKTVFAATAQDHEEMAPVLFLSNESGLRSIAARGDIDAEDIKSTEHLEEIFWKIINKEDGYADYKTVVIDSVTELQEMNLTEKVEDSIRKNTKYQNGKRTVDERFQEDYGKSTVQLKRLFRMFRDANINVIMVALPKSTYPLGATEHTNPTEVQPSLTNKLANSLMGFVDFVWYLDAAEDKEGNTTRHLLTRDYGPYRAKTRGMKFAEAIGQVVDNPTMDKLYQLYLDTEETE